MPFLPSPPTACRRRRPKMLIALALVAVGCGGETTPGEGRPTMRVAVLQHGDVTDGIELVSSSALGVDLALRAAVERGELAPSSDLRFVETAGKDPAGLVDEVREIAADPSVTAAIVTPFVDAPEAEQVFLEADVPVFSFSGLGGVPGDPAWVRLVPEAEVEGEALAAVAGAGGCAAGGSAISPPVPLEVVTAMSPAAVASEAAADGCRAVVWLGDADGALELVRALTPDVGLVVSAAARVERLPREGFPATVGTLAVVPCPGVHVDPSTVARRFVHAYQAAHGVPPGLCAAEGYTLGKALVAASTDPEGTDVELGTAGPRSPAFERIVGVRWLEALSDASAAP